MSAKKAYALASLRQKVEGNLVTNRIAVHIREASSAEEAIGLTFQYLKSEDSDFPVVDVVAMPVFKDTASEPEAREGEE